MPLAVLVGASHLYGFENGLVDQDVWQVYSRRDEQPPAGCCDCYWSVGAFLGLCASGHVTAVEMLSVPPERYTVLSDDFREAFCAHAWRLINWQMLWQQSEAMVSMALVRSMQYATCGDYVSAARYALIAARVAVSRGVMARESRWPAVVRRDLPEIYRAATEIRAAHHEMTVCATITAQLQTYAMTVHDDVRRGPHVSFSPHDGEYHASLLRAYGCTADERAFGAPMVVETAYRTARHRSPRALLAPETVIAARLLHCHACEYYDATRRRCVHPDCRSRCQGGKGVLSLARFAAARCPLGHWGPV